MPEKTQVIFPRTQNKLTLSVDGVYAFPDEWRVADEASPNLFTYVARIGSLEILGGKISPRELTPKEIRELEEQQTKKKASKKDTKK